MELVNTIVVYGLLNSSILTSLILISLYINPRIWMSHLPVKVQREISGKSGVEKMQSLIVLILFLSILLTLPLLAVINYGKQLTFIEALSITYSVNFMFNLTDLLFIDWLIICTLTPDFIRVKGVDERVYKDYGKHLVEFFKGAVVIIIPSIFSGLLGFMVIKHGHAFIKLFY